MSDGQILGYLLGQFGEDKMTREEFWKQMNARGYTQGDIDNWCASFYQLEAQKERDNERRKEEQGRTERARASRSAGAAGREGEAADRQDFQASQDRDAQGWQGGGAIQADDQTRPNGSVNGEIWITLSLQEIEWVDRVSDEQSVARHSEGAQPQGGQPADLDVRIAEGRMGTRGEAAVRKWLGNKIRWRILEPWEPGGRKPDFGDDIDVKTVHYQRAQLWLTPDCPPEWIYILVSSHAHPRYRIIGWCYGKEMMLQEHWNPDAPRDPAWVINQDNPILKSPASLHEMIRARSS